MSVQRLFSLQKFLEIDHLRLQNRDFPDIFQGKQRKSQVFLEIRGSFSGLEGEKRGKLVQGVLQRIFIDFSR